MWYKTGGWGFGVFGVARKRHRSVRCVYLKVPRHHVDCRSRRLVKVRTSCKLVPHTSRKLNVQVTPPVNCLNDVLGLLEFGGSGGLEAC
jgi:hypothetical protein